MFVMRLGVLFLLVLLGVSVVGIVVVIPLCCMRVLVVISAVGTTICVLSLK